MRAELWVKHSEVDPTSLQRGLCNVFGPDDRESLKNSEVFSAERWKDKVLFAREDPSYRMICFQSTNTELQVHVEPVTGNILRAAESAWGSIKKVLTEAEPKLSQSKLVDGASNREFLSGQTGLSTELRRRETLTPLVVAGAVLVFSIIGVLTFAKDEPWRFLSGAVSGVVAGVAALIFAVLEAGKGTLRWS